MNSRCLFPASLLFALVACGGESSDSIDGGDDGGTGGRGPGGPTGELAEEDVCGFAGDSDLPEADGDGLVAVPPNHPALWYMGRLECDEAGPRLAFPGASLRVRFSGTELRITIDDDGRGTATTTNYFDVSIDGEAPTSLEMIRGENEYVLASDLPDGDHEVVLFKRSESSPGGSVNAGVDRILGLRLRGSALTETRGPARRVEFVGDSITCGYGNEIETTMPDDFHFTTANSNGHAAYGAVVAELLDADYLGVAYSGKGMSRNYAGGAGETIPDLYLDTIPDDPASAPWDPARFVPDAVVINVGTNDFSTAGVDRELYVSRYTEFLETLRGYYPDALLVAAIGPMLSDYYPPGENAWTNAQADVQSAVAARADAGDDRVLFHAFSPQTAPYGEDWHPTKATHRAMAEELSEVIAAELGW